MSSTVVTSPADHEASLRSWGCSPGGEKEGPQHIPLISRGLLGSAGSSMVTFVSQGAEQATLCQLMVLGSLWLCKDPDVSLAMRLS